MWESELLELHEPDFFFLNCKQVAIIMANSPNEESEGKKGVGT